MSSYELVVPSESSDLDKPEIPPQDTVVDKNLAESAHGPRRVVLEPDDDTTNAAETVQVVPPAEAERSQVPARAIRTGIVTVQKVITGPSKPAKTEALEESEEPQEVVIPTAAKPSKPAESKKPEVTPPPATPESVTEVIKADTPPEKPSPTSDGGSESPPPPEPPVGGDGEQNGDEGGEGPDEPREVAQAELPGEDHTEVPDKTREQPMPNEAAEVATSSTKQQERAAELAARIERDLDLKRRWEQREDEEDSMAAGNELIGHYRRFIGNTAYRLLKQPTATVELEDVIQQGLEAFMKATQRWDGRGQLITFAGNRAYWAMYDLIAQDKHPVHIPSTTVDYLNTIWEQEAIRLHNGEPPLTDEEISELFDPPLPMKRHGTTMDVSSLRQALAFINGTYSVETEIAERTHIESQMIMLANQERSDVGEEATDLAALPHIVKLLEKYVEDAETERTRRSRRAGVRYLAMRMGFVDGSPMLLKEIAAQESITDMAVRYCINGCLDWLQAYFGTRDGRP